MTATRVRVGGARGPHDGEADRSQPGGVRPNLHLEKIGGRLSATGVAIPRTMRAALHEYQGYQYSITTISNTEKRQTVEAELWYVRPDERQVDAGLRRWRYFRRSVAENAEDAGRRVEAEFKEWIEGQREAEQ